MNRESFQSRLGFLLVSAGCAIGIGNVWKFPYVTGANGGGVFVLFYLLSLALMGVPILSMELTMGRASRKSAVLGYKALEPKGSKWHIHGWFCVIGCYLLMMYYTTVSGWMLGYFFKFAGGTFTGLEAGAIDGVFGAMLSSPTEMTVWMVLTVLAGFLVCSFGLQKGLERITKVMMLGLLCLILVLAVHSLLLPGAAEGVKFYLLPDFGRAMEAGLGSVITAAMNQAFFTLSLGIAAMEIFGSYMSKDHTLTGESVRICCLDTFVALMSGLIIFPACFSFGVEPNAGPALIFMTLPNVFNHITLGRFWGSLFFLFLTFAAFSTVLAVFENIVCCVSELTGWSRKKTCFLCCVGIFLLSLPCLLGYNLWQNVRPIAGHDILDSEDFLVSNIVLPLGSLIFVLFCTTRYGWGWEKFMKEANEGTGLKVAKWMRPYMTYVLPFIVFVIFVIGLVGFFKK